MMAAAGRKFAGSQAQDKNEIKKSSYYVWFLGAKESKGLRGEDYITPVVRYLVSKEKEQTPIKVTLQLSNKGLKIIQNVSGKRVHENYRSEEAVKHFIPHHAITCSLRTEDVVSAILLIYNPATACPVHVHSYRCDSVETAELLHKQLETLVHRPDNQKKFLEIESRLQEKGLLHRVASSAGSSKLGSDGRSVGRESDSGAGSDKGSQLAGAGAGDRIACMYDNLAAELREKLGGKQPLLLPPRDYDTVHRSRGNTDPGIENRKSLNPAIVGTIGAREGGGQSRASEGKSSGIGSEEAPSPGPDTDPEPGYLARDTLEEPSSSDDEWAEADLQNPGWPPHGDQDPASSQQPLSARFFQPRQPRSGSSPPVRVQASARERPLSPEAGAKDRFRGAKQLFMSLERRKDKERKTSASPLRAAAKPAAPAQLPIEGAGGGGGSARWSRQSGGGWPGSDRDTGYASRYSRDKSRNRDFEPEPEKQEPRPGPGNIFVKSGKKSADSKLQSKRLSRFLSRETIESDGYDQIEEFDDERQRARVKRQPSRTSLKLDPRRSSSRDPALRDTAATPEPAAGPRRGFIRREVTELDLKGYMAGRAQPGLDPAAGFSKKYTAPALWAVPGPGGPRERAMSPARLRAGARELEAAAEAGRYPKVLMPEYRGGRVPGCVGPDNRYPSLDLRTDKRKSMYEGAGEVAAARGRQFPAPATDYRRRSYHELSDVDRLDHAHCHAPRNFQHSGRKQCPDPIGLPSRAPRGHPAPAPGYRLLPSAERFPGLDRDTARPHPQPHPPHWPGPRSYEGAGRAMFRHSYAEPVSGPPLHFPHHAHGRFGLSSLKPY